MSRVFGRNKNVNDTANVLAPIPVDATTSVVILPANPDRMYVQINNNDSNEDCWIKLQPASQDNDKKGIFMHRRGGGNDEWQMPTDNIYTGEISAMSDSGTANIYVTEY
jgi:hypothetical protein